MADDSDRLATVDALLRARDMLTNLKDAADNAGDHKYAYSLEQWRDDVHQVAALLAKRR